MENLAPFIAAAPRRKRSKAAFTPLETKLLHILSGSPEPITVDGLVDRLSMKGSLTSTNTVRVVIHTLRRKLAQANTESDIETVRGYQLRTF